MNYIAFSAVLVGLAAVGDGGQIRAILLAATYGRPVLVTSGILLSVIISSLIAAALGAWMRQMLEPTVRVWLLAAVFLFLAVWSLTRVRVRRTFTLPNGCNAFSATLASLIPEQFGDKAQIAILALAATYGHADSIFAGATLGQALVIIPVTLIGTRAMLGVSLQAVRRIKAAAFAMLTILALLHL